MKPSWLHDTAYNNCGQYRQGLGTATSVTSVFLVLCTALAIIGCTASLKGVSGPVTWQATDLRVIARSVSGAARDIYAFTLVLEETHGSALTLTSLSQTVSQPEVNAAGVSHHFPIRWKLRPHGELRQPFSFYWYCAEAQCQNWGPIAPWYNIVLTGTDDRGHPIHVAIDFRLPSHPPKLKNAPFKETPAGDSGPVPFHTVGNHILIHAVLNHKEYVTLLVDTGATNTFVTPATAKRLGISPMADAAKRTTTVIGGRQVEFPLVLLSTITVGDIVMGNLQVGVLASFPEAPLVDGILGGDFLKHFTMTLDYATSRLRLVAKETSRTPPPTTAAAPAVVRSSVPIQLAGNHILVRAVLNRQEPVTLVLDTGATHTILTPDTAQRLGISPTADTPRWTGRVADGQLHEVPHVQLSAIAVGEAVVENLQVGVSVLFPQTPRVDGLLGGDFLEQFRITTDRTTRQMWLESLQTVRP